MRSGRPGEGDHLPVPRLDVLAERRAPGRRGLQEPARLRLRPVGPGPAAGDRVAWAGVRGWFGWPGLRVRLAGRGAGQAGRTGRAVRAGAPGDRRAAPL